MNLYAKGKVLKHDGDVATIQLSNEELGRAVLNYVVNNTDNAIGEMFMKSLFSGKQMTLNELLLSNIVDVQNSSVDSLEDASFKKNTKKTAVENKVSLNEDVKDNLISSPKEISSEEISDDYNEKIDFLIEAENVQVKVLKVKDECPNIYERVIKTKNGISTQIISNCDIVFTFAENNVTYSFINYKNGVSNVITPNNNLVFIWDDATCEELDEFISLI